MVRQRVKLTLHIVGSFLKYISLAYIFPLLTALYYGETWQIFLYALLLTLGVGLILELGFKTTREIERTDGFTIVAFTWLLVPVFGMIPYLFLGLHSLDALFESVSGFTTTGASILNNVEVLPRSAILWRSLTQWLGGMGVIVLFIAILPRLGVGGSQLFDLEAAGPMPERLRPRFATTARALWTIYAALTAVEIVFLRFLSKLPLFDSICISLTTLPTGGFTPTTAGIGGYGNPLAEYVIIVFMFLGGTNFLIHYEFSRGNFKILKDEEFRLYVFILLVATALLIVSQGLGSYRAALFQAVSIMTCTGFSTANFAVWNFGGRTLLLTLMFIGACGGSTGGAIKVSRVLTLIKHAGVMMRKAVSPNAVIPLKYNRRPLPDVVVRDVISFVFLYLLVAIVATVALSFLGLNLETSVSAVATSLANCGPGLGAVGPASNFALLPAAGKSILIVCMWLGRLELFTIFMIFFPRFWRG
jgi:trk system potassium uptake protein TrkH